MFTPRVAYFNSIVLGSLRQSYDLLSEIYPMVPFSNIVSQHSSVPTFPMYVLTTLTLHFAWNARIMRGGENVKVSRGLRAGSSSKRCSYGVNTRCVGAGRHSPREISSTLPVRRADLHGFTRRETRMYLLRSNASRDLDRTLTGR